jgi:hypothetical protein
LNASGLLKETIRIAISALNDDVPGCVRVAAWLDGDVLREQTTDVRATAAASATASAARIAPASAAAAQPPAAAAAVTPRISGGAGAAAIGRGTKAAFANTCTRTSRAIANQTTAAPAA